MIEFFDIKLIDNAKDGSLWLAIMDNGEQKTICYSSRNGWVEMDYSTIYGKVVAVTPIKITETKYPYQAGDLVKNETNTVFLLLEIIDDEEVKLMYQGKEVINYHENIFALTAKEKEKYCQQLMLKSIN